MHLIWVRKNVLQPFALACCKQVARVEVDMNPLFASAVVAGLPMTILLNGTPPAAISKTEVLGQVLDEVVSRLSHVVYSLTPSDKTEQSVAGSTVMSCMSEEVK